MIRAVLFDLDGTLINTNKLILESFRHAFRKHLNIEMDEERIVRFFGEPLKKSMKSVDPENADTLIEYFREFNEAQHDVLAERYAGTEEAITTLKEMGIKVGVVTSKRRVMAERSLKLIGVFHMMDVIITPEDTDKHKPDGAPMLLACERIGIAPEEALMVGDSIYDLECGRNAGSRTAAVTYSSFSLEELMSYRPNFVVDKLEQLTDIVREIA
ncbi:MAG: pyrophosphatase PpaX [Bacillota bacterium]|nr:pyrophosphatase PpaX [Bacillota bacterium]